MTKRPSDFDIENATAELHALVTAMWAMACYGGNTQDESTLLLFMARERVELLERRK